MYKSASILRPEPPNIYKVFGIVAIHCLALMAPLYFTWPSFYLAVLLTVLTGQLGITLCFHRLLAHRSYQTFKWLERFLSLCACLSMQTGPISWVATHRYHHLLSDRELDPHTPKAGFFWAHIIWTVFPHPVIDELDSKRRFARDLLIDPFYIFLERHMVTVNVLFAFMLYGMGFSMGRSQLAISFVLWGFCFRIVYVWHVTFLVNSATHVFGYQSYNTGDQSRNTWWVAILTFGEGWHNNHHAHPTLATYGHQWFEVDTTYWIIFFMQKSGLAWNVRTGTHLCLQRKRVRSADTLSDF